MIWTLKRTDSGHWYWEHADGRESPIFCVRELARRWMRSSCEGDSKGE